VVVSCIRREIIRTTTNCTQSYRQRVSGSYRSAHLGLVFCVFSYLRPVCFFVLCFASCILFISSLVVNSSADVYL